VDAFILAAEAPAAAGEAFNIASETAKVLSVARTAERVIEKVGSKSKLSFVNKTLAHVMIRTMSALGRPLLLDEHREVPFVDYVFEIEKAKKLLDYKPRKDDVEAIAETAEWYCQSKGLAIGG
jgi:nucleoside-diphosphate-sugar epimerase